MSIDRSLNYETNQNIEHNEFQSPKLDRIKQLARIREIRHQLVQK